jgi:hypothetical protein
MGSLCRIFSQSLAKEIITGCKMRKEFESNNTKGENEILKTYESDEER